MSDRSEADAPRDLALALAMRVCERENHMAKEERILFPRLEQG